MVEGVEGVKAVKETLDTLDTLDTLSLYSESVPAVRAGTGVCPASRALSTRCHTELGVGAIPTGGANTIVLSAALART